MRKVAWMLAAVLLCRGCVEREMVITSEPSGALVTVSDRELGRTPLTQRFLWYGDYEIILRRSGCETLKTHANLLAPWYEVPPLDLLSAAAPWRYRDRRYLHFELAPRELPDREGLIRRGDQMRLETLKPVPEE